MTKLVFSVVGTAWTGDSDPVEINILEGQVEVADIERWIAAGSIPAQDQAEIIAKLAAALGVTP